MSNVPPRRRSSSSNAVAAAALSEPTPTTLDDVLREVRATRALLDQHLEEERFADKRAKLRHEAVMSMLGDLLARMPSNAP